MRIGLYLIKCIVSVGFLFFFFFFGFLSVWIIYGYSIMTTVRDYRQDSARIWFDLRSCAEPSLAGNQEMFWEEKSSFAPFL